MQSQIQASNEMKHISLLRKALTDKDGMAIDFEGEGWRGRLILSGGMIESDDSTISCLTNIFSKPVSQFSWKAYPLPLKNPVDPKLALYNSLVDVQFSESQLRNYKNVFANLPSVNVKAGNLFGQDKEDMVHYKTLYCLGLSERGVCVSDYLNLQDAYILLRRIRIVLTCYCLGQFIAANSVKQSTKVSMTSRILARLRMAA